MPGLTPHSVSKSLSVCILTCCEKRVVHCGDSSVQYGYHWITGDGVLHVVVKNLSIFSKIMIIVCLLLIPLLLLFAYSNQVSTNVVKSEIEKSNVNRLSFF